MTVPRPELIVLYNGTAPYPDESILKLSDAFAEAQSLGLVSERESPVLEVRVKVYNINEGRNERLLRGSETLEEYSRFIAKVRSTKRKLRGRAQQPSSVRTSGKRR